MFSEAHFRQLLDLSQQMLAAGMAQDWDELVALEAQRRVLFAQPPDAAAESATPPVSQALIRQIQACDAELSEKLDAWMTHVRILLRMDPPSSPKSEQ